MSEHFPSPSLMRMYVGIQVLWSVRALYECFHISLICPLRLQSEVSFYTLLCDLQKTSMIFLLSWNNDIRMIKIASMGSWENRIEKLYPPTSSLWLSLAGSMSFAWGHNLINWSPAANRVEDMCTKHLKTPEWQTSADVRVYHFLTFNFLYISHI